MGQLVQARQFGPRDVGEFCLDSRHWPPAGPRKRLAGGAPSGLSWKSSGASLSGSTPSRTMPRIASARNPCVKVISASISDKTTRSPASVST